MYFDYSSRKDSQAIFEDDFNNPLKEFQILDYTRKSTDQLFGTTDAIEKLTMLPNNFPETSAMGLKVNSDQEEME